MVNALMASMNRDPDCDVRPRGPECPLDVDSGRPQRKQALLVQMVVREKL